MYRGNTNHTPIICFHTRSKSKTFQWKIVFNNVHEFNKKSYLKAFGSKSATSFLARSSKIFCFLSLNLLTASSRPRPPLPAKLLNYKIILHWQWCSHVHIKLRKYYVFHPLQQGYTIYIWYLKICYFIFINSTALVVNT